VGLEECGFSSFSVISNGHPGPPLALEIVPGFPLQIIENEARRAHGKRLCLVFPKESSQCVREVSLNPPDIQNKI